MNEQLEKLEAQCWIHRGGYHRFDREKFAKLIVQECAEIANRYYKGTKHGPGFMICEEIKQHFGVDQ